MSVYNSDKNNKKDIRQELEIWKSDIYVASSIVDELMNKINGDT